MSTRIRFLVVLVLSILNLSTVYSASVKPVSLDQEKIHAWYYAGKVDSAAKAMERFQNQNKSYSRSDSLFLSKHLGVIYSMNPFDREKGKVMFKGLLALDASASLEDMFAPPEVDSIFNGLKPKPASSSLSAEANAVKSPDASSDSLRSSRPEKDGQEAVIGNRSQRKRMFWIASGVAAATAVGVATYYLVSSEPKSQPPTTAVWDATNPKP
jgi:hypothetical protein